MTTTEPAPPGEHGDAIKEVERILAYQQSGDSDHPPDKDTVFLCRAYIAQARELAQMRDQVVALDAKYGRREDCLQDDINVLEQDAEDAVVEITTLKARALAAESALEKARSEGAQMREALMRFAEHVKWPIMESSEPPTYVWCQIITPSPNGGGSIGSFALQLEDFRRAAAALRQPSGVEGEPQP